MELLKRRKFFRVIFASLLLAAAMTFVFYRQVVMPQLANLANLQQRCKAIEIRNEKTAEFARTKLADKKYRQELEQQWQLVEGLLPDELNEADVLLKLAEVSRESGVQIVQVKPGGSVNKQTYSEMVFEVQVRGGYYKMLTFLNLLESSPRFIMLDKGRVQSDGTSLQADLSLHVYAFNGGGAR